MCGMEVVVPGKPAEGRLADLMNDGLGIEVTPQQVSKFVMDNWVLLTAYAHAIHERTSLLRAQLDAATNIYGSDQQKFPPITGELNMKIELDMLK